VVVGIREEDYGDGMSEPTLAEMIMLARVNDRDIDGTTLVEDMADFHARAVALAVKWSAESRNARVQRAILKDYGEQLLAILGDLQP